jgi:hypothetical protein
VRFVETPIFTEDIVELLPDEDYRMLQLALTLRPEAGPVVRGSGGIRKLRWSVPGRGKRGGLRIMYYWAKDEDVVYMLLAYEKNRQENLTPQQLKGLRALVQKEFK